MDRRQELYFDSEVKSIFGEFRDLLNKLEERVKQREKQVKREVREELLSTLESICENYFSETMVDKNKENGAFLEVLKSKLGSEYDSSEYQDDCNHCHTNSTGSPKFEKVAKTESTSPESISIKSETSNYSEDDASYHCQTPKKTNECDTVTQMVVPLNPTHFIDEPFVSEDDMDDSDDAPETVVPKTRHRQAVEKREHKSQLHSVISSNQCPFCFQYFSQRNSLKRHIRSHTGERPFPCDYCGKCFIDKERLKVHIRIHTGEKPFSCDVCGRHFTQKSTVKRHMSVHTGIKPYHCEHCGKRFGSKDNLKVHIKSHTRIMRFNAGELNNESSQ